MKIQLNWHRKVRLKQNKRNQLEFELDLDQLPTEAGIYMFIRSHEKRAEKAEVLYVGQAQNIRSRVKGQLNNLSLMKSVVSAQTGKRFLICASLKIGSISDQKLKKMLNLAEKTFIDHYLSEGHDLSNISGTKIKLHEIVSNRPEFKKLIPTKLYRNKKDI